MARTFPALGGAIVLGGVLFGSPILVGAASAQGAAHTAGGVHAHADGTLAHCQVLVPNLRRHAFASALPVEVTGVSAHVRLMGNAARTTLEVRVSNPGSAQAEAELLLPVPAGAAVGGFSFEGGGTGASAELLPAAEARATYDGIVARLKDPALLEFAGYDAVRSSVFPVPAGGTQRVRLVFDQVLREANGRIDYVLPRTASLAADVAWDFAVEVVEPRGLATIYSPTHRLAEASRTGTTASLNVRGTDASEPGPFRISVVTGAAGLSGSILSWPEPEEPGGMFLLVAGLAPGDADAPAIPREVTLVLDRSGSMAGAKFEQAREAARQVIEGLRPGERFRVVDYSDQVTAFRAAPVAKTPDTLAEVRAYLDALATGGGTNIGGALTEALRPAPMTGNLGLVLFLTDGLPTVGETSEGGLRAMIDAANAHGHRVFPFGVGDDVNAPLLDAVATTTRGSSTYVRPGEDVEVAVGDVFRRLKGPRLADLELEVLGPDGEVDAALVRDLLPATLPDLYEGDQLVLLGRYTRAQPLTVAVHGRGPEGPRSFRVRADLADASPRNDFVPRLWAARRIAMLMDTIRQSVGDGTSAEVAAADPRTKELADEVLRLSTRYGVLSQYTAFLALEGTDLASWSDLSAVTCDNLVELNSQHRWGTVAVNNAANINEQRAANQLNQRQTYLDASGQRVAIGGNQQVAGGLALRRGDTWIEGQLLGHEEGGELPDADVDVVLGSEEHGRLVDELVADGRNGLAALPGEVLFRHRGKVVRLRQVPTLPETPAEEPEPRASSVPAAAPAEGDTGR